MAKRWSANSLVAQVLLICLVGTNVEVLGGMTKGGGQNPPTNFQPGKDPETSEPRHPGQNPQRNFQPNSKPSYPGQNPAETSEPRYPGQNPQTNFQPNFKPSYPGQNPAETSEPRHPGQNPQTNFQPNFKPSYPGQNPAETSEPRHPGQNPQTNFQPNFKPSYPGQNPAETSEPRHPGQNPQTNFQPNFKPSYPGQNPETSEPRRPGKNPQTNFQPNIKQGSQSMHTRFRQPIYADSLPQPVTDPTQPQHQQPPTYPKQPQHQQPPTYPKQPQHQQPPTNPKQPQHQQPPTNPKQPQHQQPPTYPMQPQHQQPPTNPKQPQHQQPPTYPMQPQHQQPPTNPKQPQHQQPPTYPQQPQHGKQPQHNVPDTPGVLFCDIDHHVRIPCGGHGISAEGCQAINCCFDGQQCYFGKAVTVQCTKDAQFIVVVSKDATLPNLNIETISLNGEGHYCTSVGSNSEFAIFQFPVTYCGSIVTERPGVIIYTNRMSSSYEVGIGPNGVITRDSSFELLFQCRYTGTSIETVVIEVLPLLDPPLSVAALGPIRVILRLANGECSSKGCNEVEAAYTSFYTDDEYPVTEVLRDPVYVEVLLVEKTDPNLVLTLGRCWATNSPNPHALPQWDLLIDGCPYRDDRYLSSLVPVDASSGLTFPTHARRFIFKMFAFVDSSTLEPQKEQVYIHCSTAVCTRAEGRTCEPSCFRQKREAEASDQTRTEPKVVVTVGPVIMVDRSHSGTK